MGFFLLGILPLFRWPLIWLWNLKHFLVVLELLHRLHVSDLNLDAGLRRNSVFCLFFAGHWSGCGIWNIFSWYSSSCIDCMPRIWIWMQGCGEICSLIWKKFCSETPLKNLVLSKKFWSFQKKFGPFKKILVLSKKIWSFQKNFGPFKKNFKQIWC